jgi:DNA-binding transcriptional MerR regulator
VKYNAEWLQSEFERLGSWNKVCKQHKISPRTIDKYKKTGLITNLLPELSLDITLVQQLYDSGMSIKKIANHLSIPHSRFSGKIVTRNRLDALSMAENKKTEAGIQKLSQLAKERGLGGYRPHPNKGMRYKDIWFDSTWEVIVAKSLDESSIPWTRPKNGFIWTDTGRRYYPDFYLTDHDIYLDPKNDYLIKKDCEKIQQACIRNNIRVIVLNSSQLSWDKIKTLL